MDTPMKDQGTKEYDPKEPNPEKPNPAQPAQSEDGGQTFPLIERPDHAYDFRSDECTVPTMNMIEAIKSAELGDDPLRGDHTTHDFQTWMASITGKEAALFVVSHKIANKLAIALLKEVTAPMAAIVDDRSSLVKQTPNLAGTFQGAEVHAVKPLNRHHLTLDDIKDALANINETKAILICLQNTLMGTMMPLDDQQRIYEWAKKEEPPAFVHLDGETLWEAIAAGSGTLEEFCKYADTVSLCLTKGVCAPAGSVLVGGELKEECETNVLWLRLTESEKQIFLTLVDRYALKVMKGDLTGRIVLHAQICPDAVARMKAVMNDFFKK
ncbi:beta-eliminating lyase [Hypoxylon trugodes]|uniref:beta-eliminating lyase n=1 Tax=Hypoxylon trugodes TaxID=326681 RepID=UPI002193992B|nr:beta-eliminating lyase [Hypoxylon trugodes]KAI1390370.1 beta-eliminating lyase [Hypoxylon trugodes]